MNKTNGYEGEDKYEKMRAIMDKTLSHYVDNNNPAAEELEMLAHEFEVQTRLTVNNAERIIELENSWKEYSVNLKNLASQVIHVERSLRRLLFQSLKRQYDCGCNCKSKKKQI